MGVRRCGVLCAVCLWLCDAGCGGYADFSLPPLPPAKVFIKFVLDQYRAPVIARGAPGEWDSRDVLNPSVVKEDGLYYNFYSGFDGKSWQTGLATSMDGIQWRKQGKILSPDPKTWEGGYIAANGSALFVEKVSLYWYQTGARELPSIALARSHDKRTWNKSGTPVLEGGPRGSWDERGVADPYVIQLDGRFYLYYLGQDRARRQRLGVARSSDGVHWEKLRSNPILELGDPGSFDESGLGEPAVWVWHGFYWMLYTGRDRLENRRLGLARSSDGIRWDRVPAVFSGQQDWNSKVLCDPAVEVQPDSVRVWFGGGNIASPDENLNGQIGVASLIATAVP